MPSVPPPIASVLAASFRAALPEAARERASDGAVEEALAAAWASVPSDEGSIQITPEAFAHAIAAAVDPDDLIRSIGAIRGGELVLARAAAAGDRAAIQRLQRDHLPAVARALQRAGYAASEGQEIVAELAAVALTGTAEAPPRILQYRGRGALESWLRVAALRRARDRYVHRREVPLSDELLLQLGTSDVDPALEYIKQEYVGEFRIAFAEAVDALARRQRNLLRLHFLDGLGIDQMAPIYHLHRSTVARQVTQAKEALLAGLRARLEARIGVSGADLESILRLIESRIEITLVRLAAR